MGLAAFSDVALGADGPPTEHAHMALIAGIRQAVDAFHRDLAAAG